MNKTKYVLIQNEEKNYRHNNGNNGSQNFLIFQPIYKTFATFVRLPNGITEWGSKGLQNEKIKPPFTVNHSISQKLVRMNNCRIRLFLFGIWRKVLFFFTFFVSRF